MKEFYSLKRVFGNLISYAEYPGQLLDAMQSDE